VPPRDWKFRIRDILKAIVAIEDYTREMTYEGFVDDRKTVDAVIFNLTIIGEAANHLPDEIISNYPEIPWRDMRDMRNFVIHEYFGISDRIVWNTIK
jgi:uncharacterized protein with HEPN domain